MIGRTFFPPTAPSSACSCRSPRSASASSSAPRRDPYRRLRRPRRAQAGDAPYPVPDGAGHRRHRGAPRLRQHRSGRAAAAGVDPPAARPGLGRRGRAGDHLHPRGGTAAQARHLRLLAGRGARHRGGRRRADGLPAHPLARRAPTAGMGLADSLRGRPAGPADRPVHPPQPGRDLFRTRPPGQHPEPARRVVRQSSAGPAARPADPLRKHHHPVLPQLHDHLRPYRATPAGGHRDALDAGRRRRTGALGVARRRALRPLRAPRRADPAAPGAARGAVPGTAGNDPSPRAGSLPRRPRPALGPAWHERRGADRAAGRKLPRALRSTGFPWSMRPASPRSAAPRRSW